MAVGKAEIPVEVFALCLEIFLVGMVVVQSRRSSHRQVNHRILIRTWVRGRKCAGARGHLRAGP
jgi:hypothetical protein